jgi:transposase, IS5 family
MRPRERRETGQNDLFKARLDQIIDLGHALVRLSQRIDWGFLEQQFGAVYADGLGSPPLPTRLMAGLHILKYSETSRTNGSARLGLRTRIFNIFAARNFSSTG